MASPLHYIGRMVFRLGFVLSLFLLFPGVGAAALPETCEPSGPFSASLEQSTDPFVIRLKDGTLFRLSKSPPEGLDKDPLAHLSNEESQRFFERRHTIISHIVQMLNFPATLGVMSMGQSIGRRCIGRDAGPTLAEKMAGMTFIEPNPTSSNLKRRGYVVIGDMIKGIDAYLWQGGDASVLAQAKAMSFAAYFGVSSGVALANKGYFKMAGFEVDFGYDFESKRKFLQVSQIRQCLRSAVFCFEHMLTAGGVVLFHKDPAAKAQKTTNFYLPLAFGYRRGNTETGQNLVGSGFMSGINLADFAVVGLAMSGQYEAATGVLAFFKALSSVGLYSTDGTRHLAFRREASQESRLKSVWHRFKSAASSCQNLLL